MKWPWSRPPTPTDPPRGSMRVPPDEDTPEWQRPEPIAMWMVAATDPQMPAPDLSTQEIPVIREDAMTVPTADPQYMPPPEPAPDAPTDFRTPRQPCPHCEGTGYVKTTNDLLRESLGLLGDGGDEAVRTFYRRLLDAAPHLASLFPPDLLDDDAVKHQRDRLLKALAALAQSYDPDDPDAMDRLDTALESYGRAHAKFKRPDGTVRGATLDEYHAVKVVLFGTLHDAAKDAWKPEYDDAWSLAYDYAAAVMMREQQRSRALAARYPRS